MGDEKEKTIELSELKPIYEELCQSLKPRVVFEDEESMLRQALFIKDKAINGICNILYNMGIQQED